MATTKGAQECEACHQKRIVTLDILRDKWLCDDCFIGSYCSECSDLLEEFARNRCSFCACNDHLADISWGEHPDNLAE